MCNGLHIGRPELPPNLSNRQIQLHLKRDHAGTRLADKQGIGE